MDLKLHGKGALVTGASYGLGFACARALAQEGVATTISARDEAKIRDAAERIAKETGVKTLGIGGDLTRDEDLEAIYQRAKEFLCDIDILVVSTGHPPTYPFSKATDENWKLGQDLVLRPPIVLSRLVLPSMQKQKFGRIIFIGSIFGLEPESTSVVQSTLRTGLNAMAKCIATEVAEDGVTVNVICPGYFETPLVENLALQYADSQNTTQAEVLEDWRKYSPVKRFGKPEDLGSLVAFLASPKAEFITGTTVTIDGGAVRQY
jgi:3-oxoacyl-[acyl-carrier protein] reductase